VTEGGAVVAVAAAVVVVLVQGAGEVRAVSVVEAPAGQLVRLRGGNHAPAVEVLRKVRKVVAGESWLLCQ
jgi:hypothetical protein